jgi:hypothetical protein
LYVKGRFRLQYNGPRVLSADGVVTHNTTVVFEVRSARGVLTLGQVYRAIQGTVWVNHSWYRTLYFEGFHEAKSDYRFDSANRVWGSANREGKPDRFGSVRTEWPTLIEATGAPSPPGAAGSAVPAEEFKRLSDALAASEVGQKTPSYNVNVCKQEESLFALSIKRIGFRLPRQTLEPNKTN